MMKRSRKRRIDQFVFERTLHFQWPPETLGTIWEQLGPPCTRTAPKGGIRWNRKLSGEIG
eukprot:4687739-Pyramimonas_sp.AAC.1